MSNKNSIKMNKIFKNQLKVLVMEVLGRGKNLLKSAMGNICPILVPNQGYQSKTRGIDETFSNVFPIGKESVFM
jgi:hypothetical protein